LNLSFDSGTFTIGLPLNYKLLLVLERNSQDNDWQTSQFAQTFTAQFFLFNGSILPLTVGLNETIYQAIHNEYPNLSLSQIVGTSTNSANPILTTPPLQDSPIPLMTLNAFNIIIFQYGPLIYFYITHGQGLVVPMDARLIMSFYMTGTAFNPPTLTGDFGYFAPITINMYLNNGSVIPLTVQMGQTIREAFTSEYPSLSINNLDIPESLEYISNSSGNYFIIIRGYYNVTTQTQTQTITATQTIIIGNKTITEINASTLNITGPSLNYTGCPQITIPNPPGAWYNIPGWIGWLASIISSTFSFIFCVLIQIGQYAFSILQIVFAFLTKTAFLLTIAITFVIVIALIYDPLAFPNTMLAIATWLADIIRKIYNILMAIVRTIAMLIQAIKPF